MHVVDASVWVSRFVREDSYHEASRDWLEKALFRGKRLVAPGILLPEVAGALARRTDRPDLAQQVVATLERLPTLRLVPVGKELAELAADLAAELRLRGADALYVAVAYRLRIPLITWDREQKERSGKVIVALTPEEALAGEV
ncbi:MAG: VapC toxin family PIN domain ribonuclease [Chloroflexi bacterium]|nr:MAG: VapC toxin family PIN domain ribonuclease [Chloroflexota bacterium]